MRRKEESEMGETEGIQRYSCCHCGCEERTDDVEGRCIDRDDHLAALAAREVEVRKSERERCAGRLDEAAGINPLEAGSEEEAAWMRGYQDCAEQQAAAIRALGDENGEG